MAKRKFNDGIKFALNVLYWKLPEKYSKYIIAEMNDKQQWTGVEFYFDAEKEEIRYKKINLQQPKK